MFTGLSSREAEMKETKRETKAEAMSTEDPQEEGQDRHGQRKKSVTVPETHDCAE